jgi:hypothetical protein
MRIARHLRDFEKQIEGETIGHRRPMAASPSRFPFPREPANPSKGECKTCATEEKRDFEISFPLFLESSSEFDSFGQIQKGMILAQNH